jgi:hypothetical protein
MTAPVVGTWRLKVWETRTSDGRVDYPLGPDAVGYLTYTRVGHMSVTIMRPDRPVFESTDLLGGTPEELATAARGFVGYCGRYELRDGRVIHHIEASLFPNWVGTAQERFLQVDDNHLTLTSRPLQIGGTTTSRLVWERATLTPRDVGYGRVSRASR